MEKFIAELKKIIDFKDTTKIGDIMLIAAKEPQMLIYSLITNIERDTVRKDEWWNLHMTLLSIPLQKVTWTLRTPQMTGQEVFTMGGEERFIKAIDIKSDRDFQVNLEPSTAKKTGQPALRRIK